MIFCLARRRSSCSSHCATPNFGPPFHLVPLPGLRQTYLSDHRFFCAPGRQNSPPRERQCARNECSAACAACLLASYVGWVYIAVVGVHRPSWGVRMICCWGLARCAPHRFAQTNSLVGLNNSTPFRAGVRCHTAPRPTPVCACRNRYQAGRRALCLVRMCWVWRPLLFCRPQAPLAARVSSPRVLAVRPVGGGLLSGPFRAFPTWCSWLHLVPCTLAALCIPCSAQPRFLLAVSHCFPAALRLLLHCRQARAPPLARASASAHCMPLPFPTSTG